MHSYQILADRKRKQQQSSFSTGTSGEGTPRRKTALQSLFLGESDDEQDSSLDHVEEMVNSTGKSFLAVRDLFRCGISCFIDEPFIIFFPFCRKKNMRHSPENPVILAALWESRFNNLHSQEPADCFFNTRFRETSLF